jgi:hypothetical protein
MDVAVGKALKSRWLILIYRLPRDPSRHRVAVWLRVREAGGKATLWEGLPNTVAESKSLVEAFRAAREEGYGKVTEGAERIRRKAELGGYRAPLLEELTRTEREFRAERRRDYFRSPLRTVAADAHRAARRTLVEGTGAEDHGGAEEG